MSTEPQFKPGDRLYSHYVSKWGTVERLEHTYRGQTHGVTGDPLPDTTWYRCRMDDGSVESLDDAHGKWQMARMVPEFVAVAYGYGADPEPQYKSQAARDAKRTNYGGESYWAYLDEAAQRHHDYYVSHGQPDRAEEMLTRSLSEALMGNDGD